MAFAEHTMLLYKICFNERNKPEKPVKITDVDGFSLAELFERFCNECVGEFLTTKTGGRHINIHHCVKRGENVLVHLRSGKSGIPFDVIDIESTNTMESYDENAASMVPFRCFLSAEHGTGYALLCMEHVPNAAGDTVLFQPFAGFLRSVVPDVVMRPPEAISLPEVLDEFVSAESVEIKKYIEQSDFADSLIKEGDSVSFKLNHKRGRPFPVDIFRFLEDKKSRAALFSITGKLFDPERDRVFVSLKDKNGSTRRFKVGDSLSMRFREVLNPEGAPPLSDDEFVRFCMDRCREVEDRIGRSID